MILPPGQVVVLSVATGVVVVVVAITVPSPWNWVAAAASLVGATVLGAVLLRRKKMPPMEKELDNAIKNNLVTGFGASRATAAKYTESLRLLREEDDSLLSENDDKNVIHIPDALPLLHNIIPTPELSEIGYGFSINPVHWPVLFLSFLQKKYFNYVGKNIPLHYVRPTRVDMASNTNLTEHRAAIKQAVESLRPEQKMVLFGFSRGGATTFSCVATLDEATQNRIALVIIESAPDGILSVMQNKSPHMASLSHSIFSCISKSYDPEAPTPLDLADQYPLTIPTAFITSEVDAVVPSHLTVKLYDRLVTRGATDTHLLRLKKSHHALYPLGDHSDRTSYYNFVNELYAEYCSPSAVRRQAAPRPFTQKSDV